MLIMITVQGNGLSISGIYFLFFAKVFFCILNWIHDWENHKFDSPHVHFLFLSLCFYQSIIESDTLLVNEGISQCGSVVMVSRL